MATPTRLSLVDQVAYPRQEVSDANATVSARTSCVLYKTLTASRTLTLPSAVAYPKDTPLVIGDESGNCSATNTIVIAANGSETILGGSSITLARPLQRVTLYSDGSSKWSVTGNVEEVLLSLINTGALAIALANRVRLDAAQTLTAAQRTQVKANIGADITSFLQVSGATSLTASAAGALVYAIGGSGFTITLPAASVMKASDKIYFSNFTGSALTIAPTSGDGSTIYRDTLPNVASTLIQPGSTIGLTFDGTNWISFLCSPSVSRTMAADFANNFTAAQKTQLLTNLGVNNTNTHAFKNRLINSTFNIAARFGLVSAPAFPSAGNDITLSAGQFFSDRWKAGSGGATVNGAIATSGDGVVTVKSGSILQIVEGIVNMPEGGTYVLSWGGTATARYTPAGGSASAYASSPIVITGLAYGANITIEFTGGTIGQPQLEPGSVATPMERISFVQNQHRCARYFFASAMRGPVGGNANGSYTPSYVGGCVILPVPLRAAPTLRLYDLAGNLNNITGGNGNGNQISNGGLGQQYNQMVYLDALMTSANLTYWWALLFQAEAEL